MFLGAVPPPVSGQALAGRATVDALRQVATHVRVIDLGRPLGGARGWSALFRLLRILGLAAWHSWRTKPDIRVVQLAHGARGAVRDCMLLTALRWSCGGPVVGEVHGHMSVHSLAVLPSPLRRWHRRELGRLAEIVCLTSALRGDVGELLPPSAPTRMSVVGNAVDPTFLEPVQPLPLPPFPGGELRVGHIGMQCHTKGTLAVLDAFTAENSPIGSLTLVGPVPCGVVQERLQDTRVPPDRHLELVPTADRKGVLAHLDAVTTLLLPSASEGQPLIVLEAMARGRTVLAFDVGGVAETLASDEQVVDPDTGVDGLLSTLRAWQGDHLTLVRLARANRLRAEELFGWTTRARRIGEVVRDVVDHPQ